MDCKGLLQSGRVEGEGALGCQIQQAKRQPTPCPPVEALRPSLEVFPSSLRWCDVEVGSRACYLALQTQKMGFLQIAATLKMRITVLKTHIDNIMTEGKEYEFSESCHFLHLHILACFAFRISQRIKARSH